MGSRDHSCETCGRGGMNDDRPCICGPRGASVLDKEVIEELERMCAAMTIVPWRRLDDRIVQTAHITRDVWTIPRSDEDLDGIIALRNAAPALLAAARERDRLADRVLALEEELRRVLASALPNPRDHPAMSKAWADARALLETGRGL